MHTPFVLLAALSACHPDDTASTTGCADEWADAALCTAWRLNTTGEVAPVIRTDGDVLVDVTSVETSTESGVDVAVVSASGIPSYEITVSQDLLDELTGRPKAATDFVDGAPTVLVGDVVQFGQDIGYDSTGCSGEGHGFWPPGPACPEDDDHHALFPLEPSPASEPCDTTVGADGMWVNGVSVFNWSDSFSWDAAGQWRINAPVAEAYDADVCMGHAAGVEYHHHANPMCLADQLGDMGHEHSPIYGFAADGYPIYGPWYAEGVEAQSCWKPRDYSAASATGCGAEGLRTCVLVDPTDPSAGTTDADADGPTTSATFTSLSGNTFVAESGLFFEDFWFDADCRDAGGAALDEHNGHDHDGLGYHYHVTSTFPWTPGPTLYGEVTTALGWSCGGVDAHQAPSGPP